MLPSSLSQTSKHAVSAQILTVPHTCPSVGNQGPLPTRACPPCTRQPCPPTAPRPPHVPGTSLATAPFHHPEPARHTEASFLTPISICFPCVHFLCWPPCLHYLHTKEKSDLDATEVTTDAGGKLVVVSVEHRLALFSCTQSYQGWIAAMAAYWLLQTNRADIQHVCIFRLLEKVVKNISRKGQEDVFPTGTLLTFWVL